MKNNNNNRIGSGLLAILITVLGASLLMAEQNHEQSLADLRSQVERVEAESREQQAASQRQLQELQAQLERMEAEQAERERIAAAEAEAARAHREAAEAALLSRSAPRVMPAARQGDFINVSLIGTFAVGTSTEEDIEGLHGGHHEPRKRGFNLQGLELALDGIVDPYFRAQTNITFTLDEDHGAEVEIEEAYLETLALPLNLQVRAGQFLTEFGRHNPQHMHFWSFIDAPLVNLRMFGPDGLRNPGARVSWLAPTPFYSELFFTVQDSTGESAYSFRNDHGFVDSHVFFRPARVDRERGEEIRNMKDLLYTVRAAASHDFRQTHTVLGGVSAAFGPNAPTQDTGAQPGSSAGRTEILGADLYWLWRPLQAGAFPFVSWQSEVMWRRFEMRDPTQAFEDYGWYSQVNYGFRQGWVAGLRYDYVRGDMHDAVDRAGDSLDLVNRWRLSPNLTWFPSEFSKLRLQYNYDDRSGIGTDHSVWLQWEFSIGPHSAHPF